MILLPIFPNDYVLTYLFSILLRLVILLSVSYPTRETVLSVAHSQLLTMRHEVFSAQQPTVVSLEHKNIN